MSGSITERPSRQERLAAIRTRVARLLNKALEDADLPQSVFGGMVCIAQSKVSAWCSDSSSTTIPVDRLLLAPKEVVVAVLHPLLRQHGLVLIEQSKFDRPQDLMSAVSHATKEAAEVSIAACEAIRDGIVSDEEARHIAQESEEAGRAHFAIAEAMRARLAVQ